MGRRGHFGLGGGAGLEPGVRQAAGQRWSLGPPLKKEYVEKLLCTEAGAAGKGKASPNRPVRRKAGHGGEGRSWGTVTCEGGGRTEEHEAADAARGDEPLAARAVRGPTRGGLRGGIHATYGTKGRLPVP